MDFLDSLDLNVSDKKSRRVRSWYLYEQFKALERNQLDAARQLKDRTYQDRVLRQELSERKARRKLYDQIGLSPTTSQTQSVKSEPTLNLHLNASCSDLLDSFQDDGLDNIIVHDLDCNQETGIYYDTYTGLHADENIIDDQNHSSSESITSVVDVKSDDTLTYIDKHNREEKLEQMDLNFDEVREKLHCLERLTQMRDEKSVNDALYSVEEKETNDKVNHDKNMNTTDNNIYVMWSKLVSFAYQLIQLNHGNCYYDYGSQFLTAVLACDVLRRGINRICYILQPYVSPMKFTTDSESETHKNVKRKKQKQPRNIMYTNHQCKCKMKCMHARKYRSEEFWDVVPSLYPENGVHNRYRRRSEPCNRKASSESRENPKSSYHSIWPVCAEEENIVRKSSEFCKCGRRKIVLNPMLRLSRYLDSIMKDIDDPVF